MAYNKKVNFFTMKQGLMISIFIIGTIVVLYQGYLLYNHANPDEIVKASTVTGNPPDGSTIAILQVKQGMNRGELLDVGKLDMVEVPVELAPKGSISSLSKVSNMRLKQQIAEKEFLTDLDLMPESAVIEEGDRLIEHNFEDGAIPASVDKGSEIDIKLFIKGGADPVVVSKAVVISRNVNLLSFYMNGMEQELIKEAAAEGMLFAVQYLDGSQSASVVTYATAYGKEEYSNER